MVASVSTPNDLINTALVRIGYKMRIGSVYEGSPASKAALDVYAQTRDELLRSGDWGFAERNVSMTLLKSAPPGGYLPNAPWTPNFPPLPWRYEYAYPSDCLKVRAVKPVPIFLPNMDPRHNVFSVDNDSAFAPPQRVILCNIPNAVLVYTGQVTDPSTWDVDFVEAFAATLGRRLATVLLGPQVAKMAAEDEAQSTSEAMHEVG